MGKRAIGHHGAGADCHGQDDGRMQGRDASCPRRLGERAGGAPRGVGLVVLAEAWVGIEHYRTGLTYVICASVIRRRRGQPLWG